MANYKRKSNPRLQGLYMKDPTVWAWAKRYAAHRGDSLSNLVETMLIKLRSDESNIVLGDGDYSRFLK